MCRLTNKIHKFLQIIFISLFLLALHVSPATCTASKNSEIKNISKNLCILLVNIYTVQYDARYVQR